MYIFAEPVTEEQIQVIQTQNDAKINEFEQEVLGLKKDGEREGQNWADIRADIQTAMDEDLKNPQHEEAEPGISVQMSTSQSETLNNESVQDDVSAANIEDVGATTAADEIEDAAGEVDDAEKLEELPVTQAHESEPDDLEEAEGTKIVMASSNDYLNENGIALSEGGNGLDSAFQEDNESTTGALQPAQTSIAETEETLTKIKDQMISVIHPPELIEDQSETASVADGMSSISSAHMLGDDLQRATSSPDAGSSSKTSSSSSDVEVLAMTLTIRNRVNDAFVIRPENLGPKDRWSIEYSLEEVSNLGRARSLYQACHLRRKKKFGEEASRRGENDTVDYYIRKLREMSRRGAKWRKQQDERDQAIAVNVLGEAVSRGKGETKTSLNEL